MFSRIMRIIHGKFHGIEVIMSAFDDVAVG